MQSILIRHLAGARANQLDEFPGDGDPELTIGRDVSSHIRFDPDRDDLVSRQHSKITRDPLDPLGFQLVDLQSRNGTFLNRQRVYGAVHLNHNDVIQLGPGGPEFRFELDPPPVASPQGSFESVSVLGMKPTRSWMQDSPNAPRPVGRSTVERLLGDVFTRVKREANHSRWVGVAAIVLIVLVGAGVWVYMRQSHTELQSDLTAVQEQNQASLAQVNEELKKGPAALEAAKQEVERLETQLRDSNERNEANHQALVEALEAQRKQAAALASTLRQQQQQQQLLLQQRASANVPQAGGTSQQPAPVNPAPAPAAAPPAAPGGAVSFESGMAQVRERLDQGMATAALELATRLTQMDPNRWEGYQLAAQSAEKLNDYKLAADLYQRAAAKAPPDQRSSMEERARRMQTMAEK
jgi:serine protease Do